MNRKSKLGLKGWLSGGAAALGLVVAAPSATLALGLADAPGASFESRFAGFTPASVDPRVARFVGDRLDGKGRDLRFTPAGVANRENRSVTVAVRIDQEAAESISARSSIAAAPQASKGDTQVSIASTRYNLGMSRGYRSFAKATDLSSSLSNARIPDLSDFAPSPKAASNRESRFAARIELDEKNKVGRSPRTIDSEGDQILDVAGSYRLTRNLDVTAGVRYSQERDRLNAMSEIEEQDSQAVYIGTQFRF